MEQLAPVIDVAYLERLRALQDEEEPDLASQLARQFLGRAAEHVRRMGELVSSGAAASPLVAEAHALAGTCGMFGLLRLRGCCLALEDAARGGLLAGAPTLLARVEEAFEQGRAALLAELGPQAPPRLASSGTT